MVLTHLWARARRLTTILDALIKGSVSRRSTFFQASSAEYAIPEHHDSSFAANVVTIGQFVALITEAGFQQFACISGALFKITSIRHARLKGMCRPAMAFLAAIRHDAALFAEAGPQALFRFGSAIFFRTSIFHALLKEPAAAM
jgi:hypothetical protein